MSAFSVLYAGELTKDLEWREAELAVMRRQLYATAAGSLAETVMLRANVAMIYAHYEGFCKFALETYIDALEKLKLKRKEVIWPLAALSLGGVRKTANKEVGLQEYYEILVAEFNDAMERDAKYDRPPQISNLWPDLLGDWLGKLALARSAIDKQSSILKLLVDSRNKIAHGKKLTISNRDELDKYWHAAVLAMHEVAVGIVDALDSESYKLSSTVGATTLNHAM